MRRALIIALVAGGLSACNGGGYLVPLRDPPGDSDETHTDEDPPPPPPNWQPIGPSTTGLGASQHTDNSFCHRMALDESGRIYIAWSDETEGYPNVYLAASTADGWVGLGGSNVDFGMSATAKPASPETPPGTFYSCAGSMAFDSQNRLWFAWHEFQETRQVVYAARWNGLAWSGLGNSNVGTGISGAYAWSSFPSLILDDRDTPVIGWSWGGEVLVRTWSGVAWVGLDNSDVPPSYVSQSDDYAIYINLASDGGRTFSALWYQFVGGAAELHGERWDGGGWSALGGLTPLASNVDYLYNPPAIAARASATAFAWVEGFDGAYSRVHVRQWQGTWTDYPQLGIPGSWDPQVALDPDKRPVVVWVEPDGTGSNIHAARWDGAAWKSLDIDGGGISRMTGLALQPRVAVNLAGTIAISWQQVRGESDCPIYVLRLDP